MIPTLQQGQIGRTILLGDPLWNYVILLVQGGGITDQSSYAHALTNSGTTADVTNTDVPGGKTIGVVGYYGTVGISIAVGAEFNIGNNARCYEFFIKPATGSRVKGSQIVFNDAYGFNGNIVFLSYLTGKLAIRYASTYDRIAPVGCSAIAENETWFCAVQIYADDTVKFWTGKVSDGVANGALHADSVIHPGEDVAAGPYIGYVGGVGADNDYQLGPYRITTGVRYTADTINIPTALFPIG